jgi:hypothetical protein
MKWFLQLMEELGIDCQVGHPATIRAAEPRRQRQSGVRLHATFGKAFSCATLGFCLNCLRFE